MNLYFHGVEQSSDFKKHILMDLEDVQVKFANTNTKPWVGGLYRRKVLQIPVPSAYIGTPVFFAVYPTYVNTHISDTLARVELRSDELLGQHIYEQEEYVTMYGLIDILSEEKIGIKTLDGYYILEVEDYGVFWSLYQSHPH